MKQPYPFSALVAQEEVVTSLVLTAIDPTLGGVLILGDRGTGKSTAVRGLAALLPSMTARSGCQYNLSVDRDDWACPCCNGHSESTLPELINVPVPVVDLPLGATEDRVVGAFDIEHALRTGEKQFEPGLLAKAHRGYLYVDEVNLLEDHIVDVLLDVSASGVNVVERDGISLAHPSRFVLIGSGNPEEGELRPQLLDRFGLSVEVSTPKSLDDRMEIVLRRDEYDRDAAAFAEQWRSADSALCDQISAAREALSEIPLTKETREIVAKLCLDLNTDGLRGDITLLRAARALAALNGASEVSVEDVCAVAPSALRHRLRRDPLDEAGSSARILRAITSLSDQHAA